MLLYSQNANRDLNILGLLMQDFFCTKPAQMHYPQLAQRADFFKHKPEGMKAMCEIMEKLQEAGRAEGLAQGEKNADRRTASRMLQKNKSIEEILELVNLSRSEVEEHAQQIK